MSKPNKTPPDLTLSVQYGLQEARLPRWRLRRWVQRAVQAAYTDGLVQFDRVQLSIRLVAAKEGRALNASYRQKDYATNVLTFEYGVMPDGTASGDIVVCMPVLLREAREQHKKMLDHAAHLIIHGTLHALGYDHINVRQATRMEALETSVLAKLGITDPYFLP